MGGDGQIVTEEEKEAGWFRREWLEAYVWTECAMETICRGGHIHGAASRGRVGLDRKIDASVGAATWGEASRDDIMSECPRTYNAWEECVRR